MDEKNTIETVYHFKPDSQSSASTHIFSFYAVRDLEKYKKEVGKLPKIKKEIKFGDDFTFSFDSNAFKIYFKDKEVTKYFGLYISILKEFWRDPQDVLWSVENCKEDCIEIRGEYVNLPIIQRWIMKSKDRDALSIDAILIVKDDVDIDELQTAVMINPNYNEWEVKYLNKSIKKGRFAPSFGNRWKTTWKGRADRLRAESKSLPPLNFVKYNKESLCDKAYIKRTDQNFKAFTLMYYGQPKKVLSKGEYLCFSGKIQMENF